MWGEGDDFAYLANYDFYVGDGAGYVEPSTHEQKVKVTIYPNAKDKRMLINLLVMPTNTVKQVKDEICDITNIESGTYIHCSTPSTTRS